MFKVQSLPTAGKLKVQGEEKLVVTDHWYKTAALNILIVSYDLTYDIRSAHKESTAFPTFTT